MKREPHSRDLFPGDLNSRVVCSFIQMRPRSKGARQPPVMIAWRVLVLACGHFGVMPAHEKKVPRRTICCDCSDGQAGPGDPTAQQAFDSPLARRQRDLLFNRRTR